MSEEVVDIEKNVKGPEGLPDARKFFGNPGGKSASPWRTLIEQSN
jgi:hypothetical protein